MARNLNRILSDLRLKMLALAAGRDDAEHECERLRQEVERLRQELDDCRHELARTRMEVDFLTVSHRLADSPDHLISARRRLQRLIAKIDRCVSLLKDDADIC